MTIPRQIGPETGPRTALPDYSRSSATVERMGPESDAWLRLPPDTLASHVEQIMGDQAAEMDYQFKLQARHMTRLAEIISEVKTNLTKASHIAGE